MFGYKLKLVKKSDIEEEEFFKCTVKSLHNEIEKFTHLLTRPEGFDTSIETAAQFTDLNDTIGIYVDMYFGSKYSLPSNSLALFQNMDRTRRNSLIIIDAITEYNKLLSVKEKFDKSCQDFGEEYTYSTEARAIESELTRGFNQAGITVSHAVITIVNALKMMHHVVNGDLIRIDSGVDFQKEYKKRLKRLPKDKSLDSNFEVKFVLNTRSDKEFLLKEQVKNEQRSRTRTADGGNEKTV